MTHQRESKVVEQHERDARSALIGGRLIQALGKPGDLLSVQVRMLWDNCYRVNVVIGASVTSARIVNSYFVKTDSDSNIIASTPEITRLY